MSDKAKQFSSNLFSKTKTGIARTKQIAMVKMGKTDETVDVSFNQDREKFLEHYRNVKKVNKDIGRLLNVLRELSAAQEHLSEDFHVLYDPSSPLYNATLKNQDVAKAIDNNRLQYDDMMRNDVLDPLQKYLVQFKEMKHRIELRHTRRIDMDRYGREVKTYNEKAKSEKLQLAEDKYNTAKYNYNALNEELVVDLPRLHEDRIHFFEPVFASYLVGLSEYYRQSAKNTSEILGLVHHIDRNAVHTHPRVITTSDRSAASLKPVIDLPPPSSANAYPPSTAPSSTSAYPPSTAPSAYPPATAPVHDYSTQQTYPQQQPVHAQPTSVSPVIAPPRPRVATVSAPTFPRARALYDFVAQEDNELGFRAGDILSILNKNGEWWEGELQGKKGLLPSNYVELI